MSQVNEIYPFIMGCRASVLAGTPPVSSSDTIPLVDIVRFSSLHIVINLIVLKRIC